VSAISSGGKKEALGCFLKREGKGELLGFHRVARERGTGKGVCCFLYGRKEKSGDESGRCSRSKEAEERGEGKVEDGMV